MAACEKAEYKVRSESSEEALRFFPAPRFMLDMRDESGRRSGEGRRRSWGGKEEAKTKRERVGDAGRGVPHAVLVADKFLARAGGASCPAC